MSIRVCRLVSSIITIALPMLISGVALAQDPPNACVEMGGLAFDNWTAVDSGGSGMPDGETDNDYIRCKACHGWDHLGTDGGYARRSRSSGQTNAGAGDSDQTSRNINFTARGGALVTADMIFHAGTGRPFADGSESWVPLDGSHSAANKAANSNGYTLGNQHPDFSTGGVNALTQEQADCIAEFLNFADGSSDAYFDAINTDVNPALYTIRSDADAGRGDTKYNNTCVICHGDPATDHQGINGGKPSGGILEYLTKDGKYSELASKARWGYPDKVMTRDFLGDPTSLLIADVMLYLQQLGGTGFAINPGLSGQWWGGATRDGEGFLIDAALNSEDDVILVVSFYTYDAMGNQAWLIGAGPVDGNTATLDMTITSGAMWGGDMHPDDVVRTPWGTGTFTFSSCGAGHISLTPDVAMMGFTDLEYDINRDLLVPGVTCPK